MMMIIITLMPIILEENSKSRPREGSMMSIMADIVMFDFTALQAVCKTQSNTVFKC